MADRRYYVDGNTVRKLNEAPVRKEPVVTPERRKEVTPDHRVVKRAKRARAFSLSYTVMMLTATVMVGAMCMCTLYLRTEYTNKLNHLATLETTLSSMQDTNDATEIRMESSMTIDQIYERATKDLGMQYPTKSQIITYKSVNDDYVRQYQDVPELN